MIDSIILAPYYWALKTRHFLYDKGIKKSLSAEVPTIGIGNVTVGGTGKTPHTEMILSILLEDERLKDENIAVLSRGYKRKTRGFQTVSLEGRAIEYGDEPLQIKKKYAATTVAVCKDRIKGADYLVHPEKLQRLKKRRRCLNPDFNPASMIILDDSFQYRKLKPTVSIVLIDYNRPIFNDHLLPIGHLRDLLQRVCKADIIIVSKCPPYMEEGEREQWANKLQLKDYDKSKCTGINKNGREQSLFFTSINYCQMEPVFVESEMRFQYAKRLILFSGIANDSPLVSYLSDSYKLIRHFNYPDHHKFSSADIAEIKRAAQENPTALIVTTDKDSQRIKDVKNLPEIIKERLFRIPIKASFHTEEDKEIFKNRLVALLSERK